MTRSFLWVRLCVYVGGLFGQSVVVCAASAIGALVIVILAVAQDSKAQFDQLGEDLESIKERLGIGEDEEIL
jgi:hypothetical protein